MRDCSLHLLFCATSSVDQCAPKQIPPRSCIPDLIWSEPPFSYLRSLMPPITSYFFFSSFYVLFWFVSIIRSFWNFIILKKTLFILPFSLCNRSPLNSLIVFYEAPLSNHPFLFMVLFMPLYGVFMDSFYQWPTHAISWFLVLLLSIFSVFLVFFFLIAVDFITLSFCSSFFFINLLRLLYGDFAALVYYCISIANLFSLCDPLRTGGQVPFTSTLSKSFLFLYFLDVPLGDFLVYTFLSCFIVLFFLLFSLDTCSYLNRNSPPFI